MKLERCKKTGNLIKVWLSVRVCLCVCVLVYFSLLIHNCSMEINIHGA